MKNQTNLKSDGINAYAKLSVYGSRTGVIVLLIMIAVELLLFVFILFNIDAKEIGSLAIPLVLAIVLFLGIPIKYLLWNLYGAEVIIINTKTVSWSYDYGLLKTRLVTVTFDRLGFAIENISSKDSATIGRLVFYNYRKSDNLPEEIHATTILVPTQELQKLIAKIENVFINEFFASNGFHPFSIN